MRNLDRLVEYAAWQAQQGARRLRNELNGLDLEMGEIRVVPLVVVCGPHLERGLKGRIDTDRGTVDVCGLDALAELIASIPKGLVGPDFATGVFTKLTEIAVVRDEHTFQGGRLLRRLSRVT